MRAIALLPFFAVSATVALACQSAPPDTQLLGTWSNDVDPKTVLTLVPNPGPPLTPQPGFLGTVVGALLSPSTPGRLLVDVRRDALGKATLLIPSYAEQGFKDILCQGCDVSNGHMSCDAAIATTTDANGGTVTLGLTCQWTQTSVPHACASVTFAAACPLEACPTWAGARCGGGLCPTDALCTSASTCECQSGAQLACCDGTACPATGCDACASGGTGYGCGPSPPVGCDDDVAGSSGVCHCVNGRDVAFPCGARGRCEALCAAGAVSLDAGGPDTFAFDARLPDGGFHLDAPSLDVAHPDSSGPVDAAPCSPAKCGGCCMGEFCYAGTSPTACGHAGEVCFSCSAMQSCVSGACQ